MVGVCGCYVVRPYGRDFRGAYLPQLALTAHATILSTASTTSLTQVFQNTEDEALEEVKYAFPLYDGVTVIDFKYHIGTRVVQSKVKPKALGNIEYRDPFAEEQPAAAKDRNYGRNDMFILCLGKVPARERIIMKITFIGQLEHDAQMSSIRYRLPTFTAPIYAHMIGDSHNSGTGRLAAPGITVLSIAVDVHMETRVIIRDLHSPSHSVHTDIGRTSMRSSMAPPMPFEASAFINLRAQSEDHTLLLDRDFILVVKADGLDNPRALLESHSTIPCQRALMVNLVSKFKLPFERPEIVFVVDRTKSMDDKMSIVKSALDIFIKCLPPGIYFNICSFGHHYSFLWNKSRVNDSTNLMAAMGNIATFRVDTDATDVYPAVVAAVHARIMPVHRSLEVVMLTDGQTSNQTKLPTFARETAAHKNVRFFSLAIGDTVSHSWIEEVAKLGNGFSQSVRGVEELNPSVLKLLDGAISPHITDWNIKLDYDNAVKGDFEILNDYIASDVDSDTESQIDSPVFEEEAPSSILPLYKRPEDSTTMDGKTHNSDSTPKYTFIQAPHKIPHIQFKTTTVFLLMTSEISKTMPRTVIVSGSYKGGVISMRIPISDAGKGKTIHQLACRAAVPELKEIRG
ncbi:hypothetical protein N7456_001288 [Penicillium angulare]|uniref:VWFA domain-containing protein n=1 Tax=Penicillium angulare TaxID=116970 RepID=A0A9W9GE20_9EURO|nr:hypothetical protein N7456_001288 [Penicillium angulare]